jgi:hypothetical protein
MRNSSIPHKVYDTAAIEEEAKEGKVDTGCT